MHIISEGQGHHHLHGLVGESSRHSSEIMLQVIPGMAERGRGTIIFTGSSASVTGFAGYSDLSKWAAGRGWQTYFTASVAKRFLTSMRACAGCGKFALRGLSQSLAREFQPAGVHIAHVIIDGVIGERRSVHSQLGYIDYQQSIVYSMRAHIVSAGRYPFF
jgi:short-subunit dehydrogenase